MNRLRSEFARLFLPHPLPEAAAGPAEAAAPAFTAADLVDAQGRTRALVMELAAPADWERLRAVWQGVQSDLGLPAPAIAVSGAEGLQLWFSAPEPVAVGDAQRWLAVLARRYLPGVAGLRVRLFPREEAGGAVVHADVVPAVQADGARWSAFVAPDLVPLFEETPWLDSEPSEEGQAGVLERARVMKPGWMETVAEGDGARPAGPPAGDAVMPAAATTAGVEISGWRAEAVAFLRRVVADETAPLALRVEAAKALLQAAGGADRG